MKQIQLRGVRVNNLKEVDLDIPHGQWVAFCGRSGSGKTSLALDTLYAEGQRRYIESLSPATRQFVQQLGKPDADRIEGIPPAIAVQAAKSKPGPRATVGSATETIEYLRLLFAKLGQVVCPNCKTKVVKHSPQSVAKSFSDLPETSKIQIVFAVSDEEPWETQVAIAKRNGFVRAIVCGTTIDLNAPADKTLESGNEATRLIVVDRLKGGTSQPERSRESLETAFHFGDGKCQVLIGDESGSLMVDGRAWRVETYSRNLICATCEREFPQGEPRLFSYNSPLGACPKCEGFGAIQEIDMALVVPEPSKSLSAGAIAPWRTKAYAHELEELAALAEDFDIPMDVPFRDLTESQTTLIWDGVPERDFGGLSGFFEWLQKNRYKMHVRVFASRWKSLSECESCSGQRLNADALSFCIGDKSLADVCKLKVDDGLEFFSNLELTDWEHSVAGQVLGQVVARLNYLQAVGLGYLTLGRTMRTLSGGEAQRVQLTSSLSSTLVNMLYVLDEPSVGLHPNDVGRLTEAIGGLSNRGNTVVVVDHDETMIRSAGRVIEVGPGAGATGGEVVFDGTVSEMIDCEDSLTGDYLAGRRGLIPDDPRRRPARARLKLTGASGNNLKNINVEFPLNCLCVVTGVSGSGKSSLVQETLYGAICKRKEKSGASPLPYADIFGDGQVDEIVMVDQSPVGRSARSNPVTYVKAFDDIRRVFAETMDAKMRNMKAGHFSFNVDGGRCDKCSGEGHLTVDMQFLADVYMKCDQCRGTRYRDEVLTIRHRSKNIAEVLQMTVREAFSFFRGEPKLQGKLKSLIDVGLEYIRLGQPATTLSSGEAQRLKLALYLNSSRRSRTLFILDEPTTGLHMRDVVQLLDCFEALLAVGHSLIVVEHNLQIIRNADWVIDLGPGAADEGGEVVAEGTPEEVSKSSVSVTGKYLK